MEGPELKPVVWVGSSRGDLREFPDPVQKKIGTALQQVQYGLRPLSAKPLSGFGNASVLEIRTDYDSDTYRAVYAVRFPDAVYVLHMFQKKSRQGIHTDKRDMDLVRDRLRAAEALSREAVDEGREG
jgi:phage-related protein